MRVVSVITIVVLAIVTYLYSISPNWRNSRDGLATYVIAVAFIAVVGTVIAVIVRHKSRQRF